MLLLFLYFLEFFHKQVGKNATKKIIEDKIQYVQNQNLRQSWKFYTTAGGAGGDNGVCFRLV